MLKILSFLYACLIFSLPFNGLRPLLSAGELSGDGFFYVSMLFNSAMVLAIVLNHIRIPSSVLRPMWYYLSFIFFIFLLTTGLNIDTVISNSTGSRNGLDRFASSLGVFLYYAITFSSIAAFAALKGREGFLRITAKVFFLSSTFMVLIAALEVAGWFNGAARSILVGFRSFFASFPERVLFRISGVSYEPSFYAISMLAALPWTIYYARIKHSRIAWSISVLLILFTSIGGSRTALVGLLTYTAVAVVAGMRGKLTPLLGAMITFIAMILGPLVPLYAYSAVWSFDSISNITRSFLSSRAVILGFENLLGVGFGQVQFYFNSMIESTVALSWELEGFFSGNLIGELPPIYSWYARTLGEVGLIPYLLLTIAATMATYRIYRQAHHFQQRSLEAAIFRIAMGYSGIFLGIALSLDSYRFVPFWFMLLLIGLFWSCSTDEHNGDRRLVVRWRGQSIQTKVTRITRRKP